MSLTLPPHQSPFQEASGMSRPTWLAGIASFLVTVTAVSAAERVTLMIPGVQ
jgi:hypothetical protein